MEFAKKKVLRRHASYWLTNVTNEAMSVADTEEIVSLSLFGRSVENNSCILCECFQSMRTNDTKAKCNNHSLANHSWLMESKQVEIDQLNLEKRSGADRLLAEGLVTLTCIY